MVVKTKDQWIADGEQIFGEDKSKWKFECSSSSCGRVQSVESILEEQKNGVESLRYGKLEKGHEMKVYTSCYGPECNWVANGLFRAPVKVIYDPEKPHDENTLENCTFVFQFAELDEDELWEPYECDHCNKKYDVFKSNICPYCGNIKDEDEE